MATPTVKDEKVPYELLVRFHDDGTPKGAQVQYLRRVTLGDEVLKEDILPAQPVSLADFPTSAIMSDACRDALAAITVKDDQIAALNASVNLSGEVNTALQTQLDETKAELEAANETIQAALAKALELNARIEALLAAIPEEPTLPTA